MFIDKSDAAGRHNPCLVDDSFPLLRFTQWLKCAYKRIALADVWNHQKILITADCQHIGLVSWLQLYKLHEAAGSGNGYFCFDHCQRA